MTKLEISRLATDDDLDILVQLRFAYLLEDWHEISSDEKVRMETELHRYFQKHLSVDFFASLILIEQKVISVAFLCIFERPVNFSWPTGKTGTIYNVLTFPECRRRGYATTCVQMLIDIGKKENLSYVDLSASESGKSVYSKLGFTEIDHAKSHYTEMRLRMG